MVARPLRQRHAGDEAAQGANNVEESALIAKIAENGGADWIGDWTPNVENWVHKRVKLINKSKAFPLFIAYNIPKRDCGQYSAGGAAQGDAYRTWISAFARAIGPQRAAVVLEPDALGLLKKCLSEADQKERLELLRFAVHAFETQMNTAVYIDAGQRRLDRRARDGGAPEGGRRRRR